MTGRKQAGGADRNHSSESWDVSAAEAGMRLDAFLRLDGRLASRGRVAWALERGKVLVNDAEVSPADAGRRVATGDRIRLWLDRPGSARLRLRAPHRSDDDLAIVYEDDSIIAVNKPAGLLTVPLGRRADADSVADRLLVHLAGRSRGQARRGAGPRAFVVHRIDRDTSGLVLFARHPRAQQALKAQFERREPERIYVAVVNGVPAPAQGTWRDWLAWDGDHLIQRVAREGDPYARDCRSDYRVTEAWPAVPAAMVEVALVTGKRNQIRVQAQLHGHPLIGEQMYTAMADKARRVTSFPRQALHAWRLACQHPETGRRLALEAPLPADLQQLLARLRAYAPGDRLVEGQIPEKKVSRGGPGITVRRLSESKE